MYVKRDGVHVFELGFVVLLHVVPNGFTCRLGVLHHERQFKHFDQWEAAGRVSGQGPDHINRAIAHLVEELRWRAAELHRRIHLTFDAVVRLFVDLVAPRLDELGVRVRTRRKEVVNLQRDLLRACARGEHCKRNRRRDGRDETGESVGHKDLLIDVNRM